MDIPTAGAPSALGRVENQDGWGAVRRIIRDIGDGGLPLRRPERFADPDRLDLERQDNRHLAFGWAAHFCFGAPLARMEGRIAFATLLERLPGLALGEGKLEWRQNLGLRGLTALPVRFDAHG